MTYNVFGGTLSLTQSINQSILEHTDEFAMCQSLQRYEECWYDI